jgi:hypothetical protein
VVEAGAVVVALGAHSARLTSRFGYSPDFRRAWISNALRDIAPVLPFEVRATVRNHLAGKIEQWFFQTERYGVVFIMNVTSRGEAHEILEKLPLGVAGMMEFELIALAPLAMLIGEPPRT